MKHIRLFIALLSLISTPLAFSQISHGGAPYFLQPSILRASSNPFYVEMPSFNLDSVQREDALNKGNMRGSFPFAYKFFTQIDSKDATQTVLSDGTTVKQIGIHSAGAYSINLLLRDFEIPPGGKLFVYNADHSYVAGSFDYRNNTDDKVFPIQPVPGESIIIEYSEPANVPFKGHFIISEVNHDYRDIFSAGREPGADIGTTYACMPDVLCSGAADETVRSTVLLIINGSVACTGALLNNTSDNGKPYLLTAVHCLNTNLDYPKDMGYYDDQAGTIVAFFNYNRPACDSNINMKGSEEMSLSGASSRVIIEQKDIALLEFSESPPNYYNAYLAGWNVDITKPGTKHTNIHHPGGSVQKYGMTDGAISLSSPFTFLDQNSYWEVPYWTIGSTASGSSGSPLFDENNLVVGGLTSGNSLCSGSSPNGLADYFSVLGKGWDIGDSTNQLKTYLDPQNTGVMQYSGKDPNQITPVIRLSNANYTNGDSLITTVLVSPNNGYVYGNSNLQTTEFAEEFNVPNPVTIFGTYLLLPAMTFDNTSGVTVYVYTGDSSPTMKIDSARFVPQFINYSSGAFSSTNKTLSYPTESFVVFDNPVKVNAKKFYISYSINPSTTQFCVYNAKLQNASQANTAWVKDASKGWITADKYDAMPLKTSLAIQPLLQYGGGDPIGVVSVPDNNGFYYDRSIRMLTLKEPLTTQNAQRQLAVYSVGGQLLERLQIPEGQTTVILREQPKGTIGIVKITNDYFSCVGKIIY